MIDTQMFELRTIKSIVSLEVIRVNDAVRPYTAPLITIHSGFCSHPKI